MFCWVGDCHRGSLRWNPIVLQSRGEKLGLENQQVQNPNSSSDSSRELNWQPKLHRGAWSCRGGGCSVQRCFIQYCVQSVIHNPTGKKARKEELNSRAGAPITPLPPCTASNFYSLSCHLGCHQQHIPTQTQQLYFFRMISLANIVQGCYQSEFIIIFVVRSLFAYTQKQVSF